MSARPLVASPGVAPLAAASFVGRLPTAAAALAVLTLLRGRPDGLERGGTAVGLFGLGLAFGQPALARWVDRRGQAVVLIGSGALSGGAFVLMDVAASSPVVVLAAAALAGLATPPLEPCLRALWPALVPDRERLAAAYALDAALIELVYIIGPIATVAAVALIGSRGGVVLCAVTVLGGAAWFASRGPSRQAARSTSSDAGLRGPLFGGAYVRLLLVITAAGLPVGALSVVAVDYARARGHDALGGLALSLNAVGALVGAALAARVPGRPGRYRTPRALALLAAGYLTLVPTLPPVGWLAACAVAGVGLPRLLTVCFADAQALSPPERTTEASAWIITAFGVGAAASAAGAGLLAGALAATPARVVTVVTCAAASLLVAAAVATGERR
ncbi:MAG TPA: MFS transporter [Jatrophihabitantaceae bacterium]